jgi:hypothetical protein
MLHLSEHDQVVYVAAECLRRVGTLRRWQKGLRGRAPLQSTSCAFVAIRISFALVRRQHSAAGRGIARQPALKQRTSDTVPLRLQRPLMPGGSVQVVFAGSVV